MTRDKIYIEIKAQRRRECHSLTTNTHMAAATRFRSNSKLPLATSVK